MEKAITRLLHSRYFSALSVILLIIGTLYAYTSGKFTFITGDKGLILPSANEWLPSGYLEMWVNLGLNAVIIIMMVVINRRYNFIKAMTVLYTALFMVMQLAIPDIVVQLYSGTVIAVVVLFCTSLLFSCYDRPGPLTNRKIFMIFFLLSAGLMTQYAYAVYVLVFLIGCIQMRIFSFRVVLSALIGLITPWLIGLGSGILQIENLHSPHFVSVFGINGFQDMLQLLVTVFLTVILLWTAQVLNLFKMLTYNARRRSYNGLITVMGALTTIAMLADYTNLVSYMPTLNVCAAFAVSHFFASHYTSKSYIPVLAVYIIYIILYLWTVVI